MRAVFASPAAGQNYSFITKKRAKNARFFVIRFWKGCQIGIPYGNVLMRADIFR